jgi:predicted nuclease with TOPRIM domain
MSEVTSLMEKLYEDAERERARVRELEAENQRLQEQLQEAEDQLAGVSKEVSELMGQLKQYQEMFPCSVCGKPMEWQPNGNLGQALKAFAVKWRHLTCVNPPNK